MPLSHYTQFCIAVVLTHFVYTAILCIYNSILIMSNGCRITKTRRHYNPIRVILIVCSLVFIIWNIARVVNNLCLNTLPRNEKNIAFNIYVQYY